MSSEIRVGELAAKEAPRCPYCHSDLGVERVWECPRCGTRHHESCAHENGRCTLLGCATSVEQGPTTAVLTDSLARAAPVRVEVGAPARESAAVPAARGVLNTAAIISAALGALAIVVGFVLMAGESLRQAGAAVTLGGCGVVLLAIVFKGLETVVEHVRRAEGPIVLRVLPILLMGTGLCGIIVPVYLFGATGLWAARFQTWPQNTCVVPMAIALAVVGLLIGSMQGRSRRLERGRR